MKKILTFFVGAALVTLKDSKTLILDGQKFLKK